MIAHRLTGSKQIVPRPACGWRPWKIRPMHLKQNLKCSHTPNLWAVEFSQNQGAFHIQPLSDSALTNLGMFFRAIPSDYVLLGVARSREEAGEICAALDAREDRSQPFTVADLREALNKLM